MKKKLVFIINPISGRKNNIDIRYLIDRFIDKTKYEYEFIFTKKKHHATLICGEIAEKNIYGVIAVGGDGTVNEILKGVINKNIILGIIPCGSGNGLARHLKIPCNIKKAIAIINKGKEEKIDVGNINNHLFVNVAGIGFDAHIASKFTRTKKRGFISYITIVIKEYFKYNEKYYILKYNNKTEHIKAFFISFANSSQFGNNISIAPNANITDGKLNICIVQKPNLIQLPVFLFLLMRNKITNSTLYKYIITNNIIIEQNGEIVQLDGEALNLNPKLDINILSKSLTVIK